MKSLINTNNKKEAGTKNYISPPKIKMDEQQKVSTSLAQYKNHLQEENDERNGRKATRPGPKEIQAIQSRTFRNVRHGVLVIMRKITK